jgi:hypothetical protein
LLLELGSVWILDTCNTWYIITRKMNVLS